MQLDRLGPGGVARVVRLTGEGAFRLRLLELGLVPGTPIRRIGRSPTGDPLVFRVRGATLGLRRRDAAAVIVEPA